MANLLWCYGIYGHRWWACNVTFFSWSNQFVFNYDGNRQGYCSTGSPGGGLRTHFLSHIEICGVRCWPRQPHPLSWRMLWAWAFAKWIIYDLPMEMKLGSKQHRGACLGDMWCTPPPHHSDKGELSSKVNERRSDYSHSHKRREGKKRNWPWIHGVYVSSSIRKVKIQWPHLWHVCFKTIWLCECHQGLKISLVGSSWN